MNIKIEIRKDEAVFDDLMEDWGRLLPAGRESLFFSQGWCKAWWEAYKDGKELLVFIAKSDREVKAIWPFVKGRYSFKDIFFPYIEPLSGEIADYQGPSIETGFEEEILPLMIKEILKNRPLFGTANFYHIHSLQVSEIIKRELKSAGCYLNERETQCPYFEIKGGYLEIEQALKTSQRADIRRLRNKFKAKGEVCHKILESREEMLSILPEFIEAYNKRWASIGFNSLIFTEEQTRFFENLIRYLEPGHIHFSLLMVDGEVLSYHFGFFKDGWMLYYKPTYKLGYEKMSPSKAHISYLFEHGAEEGCKGLDFLQGTEKYKMHFAHGTVVTKSYTAFPSSMSLSNLWFTKIKPILLNWKHRD